MGAADIIAIIVIIALLVCAVRYCIVSRKKGCGGCGGCGVGCGGCNGCECFKGEKRAMQLEERQKEKSPENVG